MGCRERSARSDSTMNGPAPGAHTRMGCRMKYMLLIYGNQELWDSFPAEEWPKAIAEQEAFNAQFFQTGELLGAYGLADQATAKLVPVRDGVPAVTDGPYLEAKEYIASAYVLDCENEERALEISALVPFASFRSVELWPILHESMPEM
jgi:hypothetical protein